MQDYSLTVDKFLDHAAKWFGGVEIVEAEAGRESYAELRRRSNRMSGALAALGAVPGDRIGTLAWNTVQHLEAYYAVMGAGMVCHTLNPRMTVGQLVEVIDEAADKLLFVSADLLPLAAEVGARCPSLEAIVLLGDGDPDPLPNGVRLWRYDELLAELGQESEWGRFDENVAAGLCYTSGTTGRPKGVLYTHRGNYLHTLRALQADAMALTAADCVMVAVPMFHANGWGLPFAAPAVGSKLVLPGRRTDGERLAELMRDERVTVAVGIHTLWIGVADHLEASGEKLPDLERVIIGGSSCPEQLIERIESVLGVDVQTSWGMTELSPLGTIAPAGNRKRPQLSSGRPPVGLDLKLFDADGAVLRTQVGTVGHLRVKGASVIDRYYGDEASALDAGGYFDTGDLALLGADGNLTISGRSKDLIKSGGEWINPAEIEAIVGGQPEVSLVAVIGTPDEKWTERPLLVVQPRAGEVIDAGRLAGALRDKIARWWMPDRLARVAAMPLTGSGKIDKVQLRADFAAGRLSVEPLS